MKLANAMEQAVRSHLARLREESAGGDESCWCPLCRADMMALALSTLPPLRDEGVLLVASGGVVHNLGAVRFGDEGPVDHWARAFDEWIAGRLEARDLAALVRWRELGPHAELAAPTTEHFDPLLVAVGAGRAEDRLETVHRGFQHGNLSMRSIALR